LIGFTLTNGATRSSGNLTNEQSGGGVWCESVSATVSNCVLTHNYASQFGGAAYQGTLNNCTISNDTAFISGGGTYLANLNNCLVSSNRLIQGSGGGGATFGVLSNCLIVRNFAPGFGGGTYFSTLNNCIVSSNSSQIGGGVFNGVASNTTVSSNKASVYGGGTCSNTLINCVLIGNIATNSAPALGRGGGAYQSSLINCTVASNSASGYGGGGFGGTFDNCLLAGNSASSGGAVAAYLYFPPTILNNCTVYGNTASAQGGGLASLGAAAPTYLYVSNCIVYGNTAPTGSNYFFMFVGELTFNYCSTAPVPTNGTGNITGDPQLVNPFGGDFHLQSNSPCINAGNNTYVSGTNDLDGNPRIVGGMVDIGAYEYQTPTSILSYAWLQQYGLPTDGSADFIDSDGDGMNNWQEWRAGTDPTNPLSVLKMLTVSNSAPGLTVTWWSVNTRTYYLQRSADLQANPAFLTIGSNIVGQTGTTGFTDLTATNDNAFFYRVGVQ